MLTLGWFSTGNGAGSRGLLTYAMNAIQRGELNARIGYVFCNREPGEHEGSDQFHALVRSYGIPLVTFSTRRFLRERKARISQVRSEHDQEILKLIQPHKVELGVLAGYMLILSPELCKAFPSINLHPAAPNGPIGTWQSVIWQIIEQRASETGARIHIVTEELDLGPVITYTLFPIQGGAYAPLWRALEGKPVADLQQNPGEELALFQAIRAEGVQREQPLMLETLLSFANGALKATKSGVVDALGKPLTAPLNLNAEIERRINASRPASH
ncbi:MAG: hypothetical protein EXR67_04025 [Dehalococcoidia bacterium]|nr:hypothetical protein [Dehalococcoidia bacterium]